MKKTYLANLIGSGTSEDPLCPDLGITEKVRYSMVDLKDGTCLVKVSANPRTIHGKIKAIMKTDDEALTILQQTYPNSDLSNMDVPDEEVDNKLVMLGYDAKNIRRNSGKTLMEQEWGALKKLAEHLNKNIDDLETGIKQGRCDKHSVALSRLGV